MSREPLIDDATIVADITIALANSSNVVSAMVPVIRTAYCNGWYEGFKSGQEDEQSKQKGTYNGGTG